MSGEELLEEVKKTLNNLLVDDTIYTVLYVEYDYRAEVKFLITGNKSDIMERLFAKHMSMIIEVMKVARYVRERRKIDAKPFVMCEMSDYDMYDEHSVKEMEYDAETGRYGCDHITIIYTGIKLNNKGE